MAEPAPEDDFTSQISGTLDLGDSCDAGAFGVVYRRTIQSSKGTMEVAVKVFKIDPGRETERINKGISRELKVWLRLKHRTIVPLLGIANVDSPFPALVSQWMPCGTLYVYLEVSTTLTNSAKVGLVRGVAEGLDYLHSQNVVHGDLHPANVLIDGSGSPRLTDFGLAAVPGDADLQLSTMTVTSHLDSRWRAPEVIGIECDPERPTFKSDIYSFGGVMCFIISGDVPWKEKKHSHQISIELSKRVKHTRPDNILDKHWNFIQQCWSWNPQDRPGAAQAIGCVARKNILLFGETGVGKSALINLMAGEELAPTSPDIGPSYTKHSQDYTVEFGGESYKVFDTVGLEEPQLGIKQYLDSVENASKLIQNLDNHGGIDLLLFCIRAGRLTATIQSNYRLFHEFLCEKKVPIVVVITGLEREQLLEDWWKRNHGAFDRSNIHVAGHACVTAADKQTLKRPHLHDESRVTIRNLVMEHAADGQKQAWIGGDNRFRSFFGRNPLESRKDLIPRLMKRCGMPRELATSLADMIKKDE